jgi:hypothetical protein
MASERQTRTPTQEAKGIASAQIEAYLAAGQPSTDCVYEGGPCSGTKTCSRCAAIVRALERLRDLLFAQSGPMASDIESEVAEMCRDLGIAYGGTTDGQ